MENKISFIVLQRGKKSPQVDKNTKKRIFVSRLDICSDLGISLKDTDGIVVIDYDSLDYNNGIEERVIGEIKNRYGCNLIVKTDKGFHMYFKTSRNITKTWIAKNVICGLKTDAKVSGDNYLVIKRNGVVREHWGNFDLNNLTELPDVLLPLYTDLKYNICDLKEGSRNDSLFKHLCQVRRNYDETKDKIDLLEIANFINEVIFAEPLPQNEVISVVESVRKQEISPNALKVENQNVYVQKGDENKNVSMKLIANLLITMYDIYYHNNQLFLKQKMGIYVMMRN